MASRSLSHSSGDFLADRRLSYAQAALAEGDAGAAADLAEQALERAPGFVAALALLGRARAAQGQRDAAVAVLNRALASTPDDALGLRLDLAHLGALPLEEAITDEYVRALFDDYAVRFDRHLVEGLKYRAPELIQAAVSRTCSARLRPFRFRRLLDLGCGTGLMAKAFLGIADTMVGVDLSPRMLAKAASTRLYDSLHEGDLVAFLEVESEGTADLVVAADVFVYLARLEAAFARVRRVLEPGGLFAFTVQAHAGEGITLGEDARYAHGERHLRDLAADTGFGISLFEAVSTRQDRGVDVPGWLVVLDR